jgi:hypothetical protein
MNYKCSVNSVTNPNPVSSHMWHTGMLLVVVVVVQQYVGYMVIYWCGIVSDDNKNWNVISSLLQTSLPWSPNSSLHCHCSDFFLSCVNSKTSQHGSYVVGYIKHFHSPLLKLVGQELNSTAKISSLYGVEFVIYLVSKFVHEDLW